MLQSRIYHCLYCWQRLEQRPSGRPRRICGSPACRRAANAERRRIQRRRQAGLQTVTRRAAEPLPRGGREPLIRRLAKQLAQELWPSAAADPQDLDALIQAMRGGLENAAKVRDALRRHPPRPELSPWVWERLDRLARRAAELERLEERKQALTAFADAGLVADPTGAWVRRR